MEKLVHFAERNPTRFGPRSYPADGWNEDEYGFNNYSTDEDGYESVEQSCEDESGYCAADEEEAEASDMLDIRNLPVNEVEDEHAAFVVQVDLEMAEAFITMRVSHASPKGRGKRSCGGDKSKGNENDNDNDTQRSPTSVNGGLAYRQECRGHDPAKKNLLRCRSLLYWHKPTVKDNVQCIKS